MKIKTIIIVAMAMAFIAGSAFTTYSKWVIIGQKEANYGPDRDVLKVTGNDIFKAIKIKVTDVIGHIFQFSTTKSWHRF
jgi:hypothetical protein